MTTATKTYVEAVGRRKTATARVRITPSKKNAILINDKPVDEYFDTKTLQRTATEALVGQDNQMFDVSVHVRGGGTTAQAEAVRHGIARALTKDDTDRRGTLKSKGFLKRDPRMKERKKFGLRSARRAPQWSKR